MGKVNSRALQKMTYDGIKKIKEFAVGIKQFCPILFVPLTKDNAVVDHKHITKKDVADGKTGEDGKGLLRGVITDQANVFIGKIEKGFVRSGCHKFEMSLSSQLRHIADYIEKPPLEQKFIHPSERIKPKTLTKTQFKKICKYWFEMYPKNRTLPKYPKKKKHNMSPKWVTWLNMADELSKPKSKRKVERLKLGIVWGKKC